MDPISTSHILNYIADEIDSAPSWSSERTASDLRALEHIVAYGGTERLGQIIVTAGWLDKIPGAKAIWDKISPSNREKAKEAAKEAESKEEILKILGDFVGDPSDLGGGTQEEYLKYYKEYEEQIKTLDLIAQDVVKYDTWTNIATKDKDGSKAKVLIDAFAAGDFNFSPLSRKVKILSKWVDLRPLGDEYPINEFKRTVYKVRDALSALPPRDSIKAKEAFLNAFDTGLRKRANNLKKERKALKEDLKAEVDKSTSEKEARIYLENYLSNILNSYYHDNKISEFQKGVLIDSRASDDLEKKLGIKTNGGVLDFGVIADLYDASINKSLRDAIERVFASQARESRRSQLPTDIVGELSSIYNRNYQNVVDNGSPIELGPGNRLSNLIQELIPDMYEIDTLDESMLKKLESQFSNHKDIMEGLARLSSLFQYHEEKQETDSQERGKRLKKERQDKEEIERTRSEKESEKKYKAKLRGIEEQAAAGTFEPFNYLVETVLDRLLRAGDDLSDVPMSLTLDSREDASDLSMLLGIPDPKSPTINLNPKVLWTIYNSLPETHPMLDVVRSMAEIMEDPKYFPVYEYELDENVDVEPAVKDSKGEKRSLWDRFFGK